jgi:hypothetical protein
MSSSSPRYDKHSAVEVTETQVPRRKGYDNDDNDDNIREQEYQQQLQRQHVHTLEKKENLVWNINLATTLIHFFMILIVEIMWRLEYLEDWKVPVSKSFIDWRLKNETSDLRCMEDNCYVKSTVHTFSSNVPLLSLVVAFHVLSMSWEFVVLWPGKVQKYYHEDLRRGRNTLRWMEYGISAPLMIIVISAMLGEVDIGVYVLLATCTSVLMGLGYLQEVHMKQTLVPHRMGWLLFLCTWSVPVFTFGMSLEQGQASPPKDIVAIIWISILLMVFLFGCFGVVQVYHVAKMYRVKKIHKSYVFYHVESLYGILSATAKVGLAAMLILLIRTRKMNAKLEFYENYTPPAAI